VAHWIISNIFLVFQRGGWAPSQSIPCEFCGE